MKATLKPSAPALASVDQRDIRRALANKGLWFDYGGVSMRLRSDSAVLASQVQAAYGQFPFVDQSDWADLHIQVVRQSGVRRWLAPQVVFNCDGRRPFEPFPADAPLPMLEWGGNWLIGQRMNNLLLLHAGAVERDGLALLMPALPGSGKSTLTAALSLRGWRLLSDEFGAYDPQVGAFRAMLKPVALKNQSIDVIRSFSPLAKFGPQFPKTRKGTVAHFAADAASVAGRHRLAKPGAVILPKWAAGSSTQLEPVSADALFPSLAFNAFNYKALGAAGFDAAVRLAQDCPAWQLIYSDLDDAIAAINALWPQVQAAHAALPPRS